MSHAMTVVLALLLIGLLGCSQPSEIPLTSDLPTQPMPVGRELTPGELTMGLEAHRALLDGNAVVLDTRNWSVGEMPGRLVTDVIDLGSGAVVSLPIRVSGLTVTTTARAPGSSKVVTSLRHGPTFFQAGGWTDWQAVEAGRPIDLAGHRYIQLRVELISDSPQDVPAVRGVTLAFTRAAAQRFEPPIAVKDYHIENVVRSTIRFDYERMDQKDLAWLRKTMKLDDVIAGKKTEMDKLIALLQWASACRNVRGDEGRRHMGMTGEDDVYPWNIRRIFGPQGGGTVYGHCASYSQLMITAATALGWHARHIVNEGYRSNTHEIAEVWVNELGKWVYFDPSLGTYYTDRKGNPLGMLEMHDLFANFFVEDGKTLKSYLPRIEKPESDDKGWQRRQSLDMSKFPAVCKTNDYTYGEKKVWDWTEGQGIMTAGFLQLTPRNDFNSRPNPAHKRYGWSPEGVNGFPYWTDEKTPLWYDEADGEEPPDGLTRNWFTRTRDWNWTLNQASMRLIRTRSDEITVELGNSQPFLKSYVATIDGGRREVNSPFLWELKPGKNTLTVNCVNEFGLEGVPSSVTVELKP